MPGRRDWSTSLPGRGALILALVGALALVASALTPFVGLLVDQPTLSGAGVTAGVADPEGAAGTVRQLPLLPVGSVTREELADPVAVDRAVHDLAGTLGLGDQIDYLLSTYEYAPPAYPYAYPVSDRVVAADLDPRVVARSPDTVVELAGLLAVLAATRTEDADAGPAAAASAYSLLAAAREVQETCDLDVTLLWLVTLGDRPRESVVDDETARAAQACDDQDATPSLVRAQFLSRHAAVVAILAAPHVMPTRVRRQARAAWLDLQERFPGSPWGFAGLADLDARWADQASGVHAAPFQVLAWRREAIASYAAASSVTDDPHLEVRTAELQVLVGQEDEARAQARAAVEDLPDDVVARMGLSDVLAATGDHEAAAESIETELALPSPWWLGLGASTSNDLYRDVAQQLVPQVNVVDASTDMYGGGFVSDLGFLPQSRTSFGRPDCRRDLRVRELMLAGDLSAASAALAAPPPATFGVAELCLGGATDAYVSTLGPVLGVLEGTSQDSAGYELTQDFLRADHDLEGAQDVALAWVEAHPDDGLAYQRLGEIYLLANDDDRAQAELESALPLLQTAAAAYDPSGAGFEPNPVKDLCVGELQLGLALDRQGEEGPALMHYEAAARALVPLKESAVGLSPESGVYPGDLEASAHGQAGALLAAEGKRENAIEEYRLALEAGTPYKPTQVWTRDEKHYLTEPVLGGALSGAEANNLALLLSLEGEDDEAVDQARAALEEDPASSVFTDTLAYTYQRRGDDDDAISAYRRVVRADPTAYVSANNLGVLLAESGDSDQADHWFRQAIGTEPDYAQAWHNLGSLLGEQWSPRSYVASQAALAEAVRLDSSFRNVQPGFAMDSQIRDLDLDVSKPLDPDWQFANSVEDRHASFTVVLLLLVLLRIAWSLGLDRLIGSGAEGALTRSGRLAFLSTTWPAWVAATLCVGLLSGSLLWRGLGWPALLVVLGVLGLVTLPLALRRQARHRSWLPSLLVGVALLPLGTPFVPYPNLVASKVRPTRLLLMLPAVVAAVALGVFALESTLVGTPVAHRMTAASAVLLASVLVPVPPLDGSRLTSRTWAVAAAVVLGGVTVALALGRV